MGKVNGFLEARRIENPFRPEAARLCDYKALHTPLAMEQRQTQASRCMNCGVPYCQSRYGCPLHNLIPEWDDLLYRGQEHEALERLCKTSPFPEWTGRVCPALCEKACMLASDGSVTNRDNELYLIEEGFRRGWVQPRVPANRSGKRVAVVGAGPAGLAVADRLNQYGHQVTVLERADRAGGLLMYGIPNMKLPKEIIERRIELLRAEGVAFLLRTEAAPELLAGYDAAVLCCGAKQPRALHAEGDTARGVKYAVDYLSEATRALLEGRAPTIDARGRQVIVVGGGDTGNDCVATCLRQGCAQVTQLEMLPAPPTARTCDNPWPEWPRTLRTDYGQLEAIIRQGSDPREYETTVQRVLQDEGGNIIAVETVRVERMADGRFQPIPGTKCQRPCELLLIAAGFVGCEATTAQTLDFALTSRGVPATVNGAHHIRPGLYAAGDLRTGQSLVVRAIADGLAAADEVHAALLAR